MNHISGDKHQWHFSLLDIVGNSVNHIIRHLKSPNVFDAYLDTMTGVSKLDKLEIKRPMIFYSGGGGGEGGVEREQDYRTINMPISTEDLGMPTTRLKTDSPV